MKVNGAKSPPVVLVVEDEALIRMTLVDYLEEAGFTVREADGADVAVKMLTAGEAVDAVVTDVRMPGSMNGLGLISWIRDYCGVIPVIVTSGYVTRDDVRQANATAAVIPKPYAPRDISDLLHTLIRSASYTSAEPAADRYLSCD
ncbi:MAG: response regulator [Rhodospirillales bacterium]|jgi:CheY-like chemotaxis protein|nr:response regulator [Rhodospirillales bacterium]MDB5383641.1 response regulator [Rhodospirillales bacterium]